MINSLNQQTIKWRKPIMATLVAICSVMISSCSQNLQEYENNIPKLDLQTFFQGSLSAHGIIQDHKGQVIRMFRAELSASWQKNQGVIDEKFYFNDGKIEYRCWRIEKNGDSYIGQAGDVDGLASGQVKGNTLNWQYYLNVQTDNGERRLHLDDWLYLVDNNTLLNRTSMSFYGLEVAELTLSISKQPQMNYLQREECQL